MTFRVHALAAAKVRKAPVTAACGTLITIRVDPQVWAKAIEIAEGDYRRIQIVDDITVIVHNRRIR